MHSVHLFDCLIVFNILCKLSMSTSASRGPLSLHQFAPHWYPNATHTYVWICQQGYWLVDRHVCTQLSTMPLHPNLMHTMQGTVIEGYIEDKKSPNQPVFVVTQVHLLCHVRVPFTWQEQGLALRRLFTNRTLFCEVSFVHRHAPFVFCIDPTLPQRLSVSFVAKDTPWKEELLRETVGSLKGSLSEKKSPREQPRVSLKTETETETKTETKTETETETKTTCQERKKVLKGSFVCSAKDNVQKGGLQGPVGSLDGSLLHTDDNTILFPRSALCMPAVQPELRPRCVCTLESQPEPDVYVVYMGTLCVGYADIPDVATSEWVRHVFFSDKKKTETDSVQVEEDLNGHTHTADAHPRCTRNHTTRKHTFVCEYNAGKQMWQPVGKHICPKPEV